MLYDDHPSRVHASRDQITSLQSVGHAACSLHALQQHPYSRVGICEGERTSCLLAYAASVQCTSRCTSAPAELLVVSRELTKEVRHEDRFPPLSTYQI